MSKQSSQSSTPEIISKTKSLEQYVTLENQLRESQNRFEKLKTEILTKENDMEDLAFLLEEAKSEISEIKKEKYNQQITPIIEVIKI